MFLLIPPCKKLAKAYSSLDRPSRLITFSIAFLQKTVFLIIAKS